MTEILAKRAGLRCSNPGCRQLTSGPRDAPDKATNIGVASHITAAAAGGPRFDESLTSPERRSVDNGIWLCQNCGKLVDNDEDRFPKSLLREWKSDAEEAARAELEKPRLAESLQRPKALAATPASFLPDGPVTWRLRDSTPVAELHAEAASPSRIAEGLGRWDSWSIHNLWANRPITRGDFDCWALAFNSWQDEVVVWMRRAGCPFLDVKEFSELGRVVPEVFHQVPELNHQLVMLNMKRERLKGLIERYRSKPEPRAVRPMVTVSVGSGTARPGDGRLLPSADITVHNAGDPFTLVAKAALIRPPAAFPSRDTWVYEGRAVMGGDGESWFHIATIGAPVRADDGFDWLVKLRGERMLVVRRWQGSAELSFDVEWKFFVELASVLMPLAVVLVRVDLSQNRQLLEVVKIREEILRSVFQKT